MRKRLDIEDVADVVRKSRLGWFSHLGEKRLGRLGISLQKYGCPRKCRKGQTKEVVDVLEDDLKKAV